MPCTCDHPFLEGLRGGSEIIRCKRKDETENNIKLQKSIARDELIFVHFKAA